jgi:hypothetical protein
VTQDGRNKYTKKIKDTGKKRNTLKQNNRKANAKDIHFSRKKEKCI